MTTTLHEHRLDELYAEASHCIEGGGEPGDRVSLKPGEVMALVKEAWQARHLAEQVARLKPLADNGAQAYLDALKADAAYMRSLGLTYEGLLRIVAAHSADEMSTSKLVELVRAAARVMAEDEVSRLRAENERLTDQADHLHETAALRCAQAEKAAADAFDAEARRDQLRDALRALVDALPRCDAVGCNRPATACSHGPQWCDEHNAWDSPWGKAEDVVCAEPLRRALAVLGET